MSLVDQIELSQNERIEVGEQLLKSGTKVRLRLSGNSMFPTIRANDTGIVAPISDIDLKIGRVVVFASNGRWIAHRLVSIRQDAERKVFIAQGDSVPKADKPICEEDIVGIIETVERKGITLHLSTPKAIRRAWLMVKFRPILQTAIRFFLKVSNKLISKPS